jgi:adenylylsulfate kinase-like enzyme
MDGNKLKITISGPAASGKTTIALLIERVLRFNDFTTTIDDVDTPKDREDLHADVAFQKLKLVTLAAKTGIVEIECVSTSAE